MSRRDNISANVGRIYAAMVKVTHTSSGEVSLAPWVWAVANEATKAAIVIEDAVDAAENARQDALNKANEAKRELPHDFPMEA